MSHFDSLETRCPQSTYRLQFHAGFTFADACDIAGYLNELGVTHAYASPYLKARAGSTHGYDVVDHCRINPELGGEEGLERWVAALASQGLSHILDIVPNHAGVGTNDNNWWNSVLEHGRASRYASAFDITWRGSPRASLHDRVLLPVLGESYATELQNGEIKLKFDPEAGSFSAWYYDRRFPLDPRTYGRILGSNAHVWKALLTEDDYVVYRGIIGAARSLRSSRLADLEYETRSLNQRLSQLAARSDLARQLIDHSIARFNPAGNDSSAAKRLDALLERQPYQLACWRVAPDEINYRRFFDINDLAGLRMECRRVFEETHTLVLRLVKEGKIAGLRIDHPDGLYDPKQYLERLQERAAPPAQKAPKFYVVVEKILAADEALPADWPVAGTSGYDFLNKINGLFVQTANVEAFSRLYAGYTGSTGTFADLAYGKKKLVLRISLASELEMLSGRLVRLAEQRRQSRDFTRSALSDCLREVIACFPVYRTYIDAGGASARDCAVIDSAVQAAEARNPYLDPAIFRFVADILTGRGKTSPRGNKLRLRFSCKFQQLTAPVTAKGVEDTAFYLYNRLISLNEVGGDPDCFGVSLDELHKYLQDRQLNWPGALSALSTHDTKRAEDARARINVLSEIPNQWFECVQRWHGWNACHRRAVGVEVPDANEELMLYQALVGAWPIESGGVDAEFVSRIKQFAEKALREGKLHSSWTRPDVEYEKGVATFIERILDEGQSADFLRDFRTFHARVSDWGFFNSLSQTLLKLTAPGVPDTYQGSELWDLSMVDPDNRRPVDYAQRQRMLMDLSQELGDVGKDRRALVRHLLQHRTDGRIKMLITRLGLDARKCNPELFSRGDYVPVTASGPRQDHIFGFCRRLADRHAVIAVGRFYSYLTLGPNQLPLEQDVWTDTSLLVPMLDPAARLRDVFTNKTVEITRNANGATLLAGELFSSLPIALLLPE